MLAHVRVAIFTLIVGWAFGTTAASAHQPRHYPRVISAKVPLYPPLAWSAHISGVVKIQITVDDGRVVNAQVKGGI